MKQGKKLLILPAVAVLLGMGNQRAWWRSHQGMDLNHTAQLVLAKSTDDGKTWSEPINITEQVKLPGLVELLGRRMSQNQRMLALMDRLH